MSLFDHRNMLFPFNGPVGRGVFKPPTEDLIQWLYGYDGDIFLDKVAESAEVVSYLEFDGVDGNVQIPSVTASILGGDVTIYSTYKTPSSFTKTEYLYDAINPIRFGLKYGNTGNLFFNGANSSGGYATQSTGLSLSTDTWYWFKQQRVGNVGKLYYKSAYGDDWILIGDAFEAYPVVAVSDVYVLSWPSTYTSAGRLAHFSAENDSGTIVNLPLQEGEGLVAGDTSGNGNDGTISGGVTWGSESPALDSPVITKANCLDFDGTQYLQYAFGDTSSPDGLGSCTIRRRVVFSGVASTQVIWSFDASWYRLFLSSGTLRINDGTGTGVPLSAGIEYLLEVDYNDAGEGTTLRVNGAEMWSGIAAVAVVAGSATGLTFGSRYSGTSYGAFFNGTMFDGGVSNVSMFQYPSLFDWTPSEDIDIYWDSDASQWTSDYDITSARINSANIYYVSVDGDDSNGGGSLAQAKASVNGVRSQIVADGITDAQVLISSGTYVDQWGNGSDTVPTEYIGQGEVIIQNGIPTCGQSGYVYIENVTFDRNYGGLSIKSSATPSTDLAYLNNCTMQNSLSGNGLTATYGGELYLSDCVADNNMWDGFNYHIDATETSSPKTFELRCAGTNNGHDGGTSHNGSTTHENGRIVRLLGTYTNNLRNVHDTTSSSAQGTQTIILSSAINTSRGDPTNTNSFNVGIGYATHSGVCLGWVYDSDIDGGAFVDVYIGPTGSLLINTTDQTVYNLGTYDIGDWRAPYTLDCVASSGYGLPPDVSGSGNNPLEADNPAGTRPTWTTGNGPAINLANGFTPDGSGGYDPALIGKTKSVATFDGALDKLTKTGVLPTDNYTVEGTSVPTAGTGEITFTAGTVKKLLLDGVEVADFTNETGRLTTTVDGYAISVGAGDLDAFWAERYADPDGVGVDAKNYLSITNPGTIDTDLVHNGCEVSLRQTDEALNTGEDNLWHDGTDFKEVDYQDFLAHVNYDGNILIYSGPASGYIPVTCALTYDPDKKFTLAEWNKLAKKSTLNDTYAPAKDLNGDWIYDVNGDLVLFPPPEGGAVLDYNGDEVVDSEGIVMGQDQYPLESLDGFLSDTGTTNGLIG